MDTKRNSNRESSQQPRRQTKDRRRAIVLAVGIMGAAVTGYYVGLSSPMNPEDAEREFEVTELHIEMPGSEQSTVIPATSYAEMAAVAKSPNQDWATRMAMLKQEPYDPFAEIQINEEQKLTSLANRAQRRAYNGAPPTVPHPIDQMTSRGCLTCHGEGIRSPSLHAAKMPHPYYANCTQCHVEQVPQFTAAPMFRENSFAGLSAPQSGARAYPEAPPVVPHTTWLRDDCLSCHGRTARPGMETTHPWRSNCLQCHGTSSQLEQTGLAPTPRFLPPPMIKESDE
jgi:cytochrome c-type protein NapB